MPQLLYPTVHEAMLDALPELRLCYERLFNDWDNFAHPLKQGRSNDEWVVTLELDVGRAYQFRYLVNGVDWHNDWKADDYVPNPFGGDNSVVKT